METIENLIAEKSNKRKKERKIPNQHNITTDRGIYFKSYSSIIAFIPHNKTDKLVLGRNWAYSRTTLKYLYKWLDDHNSRFSGLSKSTLEQYMELGHIFYNPSLSVV